MIGTFVGVPIIKVIVVWGPYWGAIILGNYYKIWNLGFDV